MYVAGYKFKVLSPVFTVHWGLQTRKSRPAWRERQNSVNRKHFEVFKKEVFARYTRDPLKMIKNPRWSSYLYTDNHSTVLLRWFALVTLILYMFVVYMVLILNRRLRFFFKCNLLHLLTDESACRAQRSCGSIYIYIYSLKVTNTM